MTGRRVLVGLSLLCALAFIAFSAGSASAATSGTTAVTCVSTANNGPYTDAHCDTTSADGTGGFKHAPLVAQTTTEVQSTNSATAAITTKSTPAVFDGVIGGLEFEIEATTVSGEGTLENKLESEVHKILGSGIVITYTNVKVIWPPECQVHSPGQPVGTIKTTTLKSESVEGIPMTQKFSPAAGTEVTAFEFENDEKLMKPKCLLHHVTAKLTGTTSAEPLGQMTNGAGLNSAGATLNIKVTKATEQLKVGNNPVALTGLETIKMKDGNPIATTGPPFP